jgi:hypothetical protein
MTPTEYAKQLRDLNERVRKDRLDIATLILKARREHEKNKDVLGNWCEIAAYENGVEASTVYEWVITAAFVECLDRQYKISFSHYATLARYADKLSAKILVDLLQQCESDHVTVETLRGLIQGKLDKTPPETQAENKYRAAIVSLRKIATMPFIPQALMNALNMAIETMELALKERVE